MSTRYISWAVKVHRTANLLIVMESGNVNLLESSGTVQLYHCCYSLTILTLLIIIYSYMVQEHGTKLLVVVYYEYWATAVSFMVNTDVYNSGTVLSNELTAVTVVVQTTSLYTSSLCYICGTWRVTVQLLLPQWLSSNVRHSITGSVLMQYHDCKCWQHADCKQNTTCILCARVTNCWVGATERTYKNIKLLPPKVTRMLLGQGMKNYHILLCALNSKAWSLDWMRKLWCQFCLISSKNSTKKFGWSIQNAFCPLHKNMGFIHQFLTISRM